MRLNRGALLLAWLVVGASCRRAEEKPVPALEAAAQAIAQADAGSSPSVDLSPPPLDDTQVPIEADPAYTAFTWRVVSSDGKVEWSQRLVRAGECVVSVRELPSGTLRWVAPGCIARRTSRLHASNDADRLLVVEVEPQVDPEVPGRTIVAELRSRSGLVRRWRAAEMPGAPERFIVGPRLAWVRSRDNAPAIKADARGLSIERRDDVVTLLAFDTAAAPDVVAQAPPPPGCPTGPCRWLDESGLPHVVGEPEDVPERFRLVARSVSLERAVEAGQDPERTPDVSQALAEEALVVEQGGSAAPAPVPSAAPAAVPREPDHFDRVRGMMGLPPLPEKTAPPPRPDGRCELRTDPMTGVTKTVCE